MTGRPPLPIGTHGKIITKDVTKPGDKGKTWRAHCYFRDADGKTRPVERRGKTKTAAENALHAALSERRRDAGEQLNGDSRVRAAAALWFEQRETERDEGDLAPNTLRLYESSWRLHVEPALGDLRLRECTVARCETWKQELRRRKGPSTTRTARAVLSGVLGLAARMGALPTNPARDLSVIAGKRKRTPRALTRDEREQWLAAMEDHAPLVAAVEAAEDADDDEALREARKRLRLAERAVRWSIPDLTRFMLATGCRIGEALALTWDEVDLDAGTVAIRWHLVRVKGEGLVRMPGAKSEAGDRVLRLPRWAVTMLFERRLADAAAWPVFPDRHGGWRDPSNVQRVLRESRDAAGFGWVTSHVFRQTVIHVLDEAGLSTREVADQAGHARIDMTQSYMQRGVASERAAAALEDLL